MLGSAHKDRAGQHLGHALHGVAELLLGLHDRVERALQHRAGVQVQRPEAHLLLPKLLLQCLPLWDAQL